MISKSMVEGLFGFPTAGLGFVRFESRNFLFQRGNPWGCVGSLRIGLIGFSSGPSAIAVHRVICGGPNPEEWPDRMKGEKTDPPARVNGILVRVIPSLSHMIRDVVNRDHPVSEDQDDKDEDGKCKIAQKVHGSQLLSVKSFEVFNKCISFDFWFTQRKITPASLFDRLNSHSQRQCLLDFSRTKKASIKFALLCRPLPLASVEIVVALNYPNLDKDGLHWPQLPPKLHFFHCLARHSQLE
jgi:hypothetical protein